jgi:hypothetical protein
LGLGTGAGQSGAEADCREEEAIVVDVAGDDGVRKTVDKHGEAECAGDEAGSVGAATQG